MLCLTGIVRDYHSVNLRNTDIDLEEERREREGNSEREKEIARNALMSYILMLIFPRVFKKQLMSLQRQCICK